ncbi:hypothetical protein DESC_690081 [Desulfosarcina cetonica]|nr:hypothetical protein DESC_690081 [Desulfosarcina cetonica]
MVMGRRGAELAGGANPAQVFHRPCPEQQFPVVATGLQGKGRRHEDDLRALLDQPAEQFRKAKIVTGAQAKSQVTDLDGHRFVARRKGIGLLVDLAAGDFHIEEVNLAVLGDEVPIWIDDDRRVENALVGSLQKTARVDINPMPDGFPAQSVDARPVHRLGVGRHGFLGADIVEILGKHDQLRPVPCEAVDQVFRLGKIGLLVVLAVHLTDADPHADTPHHGF